MVHSPKNFLVALQWLQVLNEYILTFGCDIGTSFRDVGFDGLRFSELGIIKNPLENFDLPDSCHKSKFLEFCKVVHNLHYFN
jgi:hypothetical protein